MENKIQATKPSNNFITGDVQEIVPITVDEKGNEKKKEKVEENDNARS